MVRYSLNNKNLLVKFEMTELDHHVSRAIREEIDEILMTIFCIFSCVSFKF